MTIKQEFVQILVFCRSYRQWKKLAKEVESMPYELPQEPHLVIVPCDPWAVGGSRGDEAMITGVIHQYRKQYPNIPIHMVCANAKGEDYINNLPIDNIAPIPSWNGAYSLGRVFHSIVNVNPTDIVVLGADCMDGHYGTNLSLGLLSIYDLCSKLKNIKCRMLGFSFNDHPTWMMVLAFKSLSSDIKIRLRDAVSLARFGNATGKSATLVADAAFMLQPQFDFPLYDEIKTWADRERAKGQTIIGLNFHPMLRKYDESEGVKSDAILLASNVEKILEKHPNVSFVFIPHDDRSNLTDNLMLSTMSLSLHPLLKERFYYNEEVPRAPQLKAICGLLDGLISSRMHLAIAALGMEVPVMAATYQGKFEGLFQHFGLDETYLLDIKSFLSKDMVETFDKFLVNLPQLREKIQGKLPQVVELSKSNIRD